MRIIAVLALLVAGYSAQCQVDIAREVKNDSLILKVKNELPIDIRLVIKDSINSETIHLKKNDIFKEVLRIPLGADGDTSQVLDSYSLTVRMGDENAIHDKKYKYGLPFVKGKGYELIQGYNGSFSHNNEHSFYALDFKMPKGDTVCAAREGQVIWTESHHDEGGKDPTLVSKTNRVMIMHSDGTMAMYGHLLKNGILVELGDYVFKGQPVGLSGNSGYSTTPHLHFVVFEDIRSVPFLMKKIGKKPREGKIYLNR